VRISELADTYTGQYRVLLQDLTTGEMRWYQPSYPWHEASEFWWTEGNAGCNCNRALFFTKAAGEQIAEDIQYAACVDDAFPDGMRYKLLRIETLDGGVLLEKE
jgi:hypothetical protein